MHDAKEAKQLLKQNHNKTLLHKPKKRTFKKDNSLTPTTNTYRCDSFKKSNHVLSNCILLEESVASLFWNNSNCTYKPIILYTTKPLYRFSNFDIIFLARSYQRRVNYIYLKTKTRHINCELLTTLFMLATWSIQWTFLDVITCS